MSESKRMSVIGALVNVLAFLYCVIFETTASIVAGVEYRRQISHFLTSVKFRGAVSEMSEQFL